MTDTQDTGYAPAVGTVRPELLAQLSAVLWLPDDLNGERKAARTEMARALLEDMAPAPGIEGLLAVQMVATHMVAMDCLCRTTACDLTDGERDRAMGQAGRLMGLYVRQTDVLGRHRARETRARETRARETGAREAKRVEQQAGPEPEERRGDPERRKIEPLFTQPNGTPAIAPPAPFGAMDAAAKPATARAGPGDATAADIRRMNATARAAMPHDRKPGNGALP